jgi:hypothetical protein
MWMIELIGLSLVCGTVLGITWRITEDWWEKREQEDANKDE